MESGDRGGGQHARQAKKPTPACQACRDRGGARARMGGMPDAPDFASGPLVGVRVIDLSRVLAGPYVGRILADFGADVIKVEPPEGDLSRLIAPKHDRGMSALFTFANAVG